MLGGPLPGAMLPLLRFLPSWPATLLLLGALGGRALAAGSITGVCPDGSIFVVQRPESIPCARAKLVEPHELPPLRPELLPSPYTWEVYREGASPHNPYNLIDEARKVRSLATSGDTPSPAVEGASPLPPPVQPTGPEPSRLGLSEDEIRDLFLIVELSQDAAPAAFVKQTADGEEAFALAFAGSSAFAEHLAGHHPRAAELGDGPVLLWSAVAQRAESFHPNFTFTQGHLAYSPESGDGLQLGVLLGAFGELQQGEVVLGWVVLPERMSLAEPMGVYWNDRRLEVLFQP